MEIRAALVWALLQLSLYCKNRGRRWRYTTAVGSSSGHLADNHDCQPNRTVSIRKYPTIPDMEASSPWGSVKVSGKVQLLLVWSSSWWSCGRAPLQTDSTPGGSTGVLTSGSLRGSLKGSRCCRCDTQRPSPYLWPCSSLRRSESCWNESWHSVLQTGHWSDSSRCGNGASGHLKQNRHFQNIIYIHIKLSLILYCCFQVCIMVWILVNLTAFKFALCDI